MLILNKKLILERSINHGCGMDFNKFAEFNGVYLIDIFKDNLINNINDDIPIYMNDTRIESFGYGKVKNKPIAPISVQKKSIIHQLNNNINFKDLEGKQWWDLSKSEYKEFRNDLNIYPKSLNDEKNPMAEVSAIEKWTSIASKQAFYPSSKNDSNKSKYLILMPDILKELIMTAHTDDSAALRRYFIQFENLARLYFAYLKAVTISELNTSHDIIVKMLQNIAQKSDNESKKSAAERDKSDEERNKADHRFNMLLESSNATRRTLELNTKKLEEIKQELIITNNALFISNTHLNISLDDRIAFARIRDNLRSYVVILQKDINIPTSPYYFMRTQKISINNSISRLRAKAGNSNISTIFTLLEPSAIYAWIAICNKYAENITKNRNWFTLQGFTIADLINNINDMVATERKNPDFI